MATITKDLGVATAYGYAVAGGYTGTEEEFAELMASYASVAQEAEESAETAEAYAKGTVDGTPVGSGDTGYHDNAKYYAEQASGSATNAGNSADAASGSASGASASALKSEGHAVGQQNGSDVGSGSPYYHNNAKYYKEQAGSSASAASGSAGTAADQALVSEGYAKGTQSGTPVASGTYYHDNAKYYKEQADGDASSASASATAANTDALKAEGFAVGKQNGTDVGSGSPYYENNAKYYASEAAASATEAAASAASIDPDTLAKVDGYYESMTVGNAEQLVATVGVEDSVPFNFRTTGGSADVGDRKTMEIVGGTVAWNQLIATETGQSAKTQYAGLFSASEWQKISGHKYLIRAMQPAGCGVYRQNRPTLTVGYKTYAAPAADTMLEFIVLCGTSGNGSEASLIAKLETTEASYQLTKCQVIDLTQMFGATIADYIYSLETANAGSGVAWFKKLFPKPYYAYNAGELMSVKTSAYKTVGFNAFNGVWNEGKYLMADGSLGNTSGAYATTDYIPILPDTTYYGNMVQSSVDSINIAYYDAEKNFIPPLKSSVHTYKNHADTTPSDAYFMRITITKKYTSEEEFCINLSWDGERDGEYEAYETHTYALDSDLELRGIPKLDADNQLYYDGDTYEADGTVTRKYKVYDLGTMNWYIDSNRPGVAYSPSKSSELKRDGGIMSASYVWLATGVPDPSTVANYNKLISLAPSYGGGYIYVVDHAFDSLTAEEVKAALSGVYAVIEITTPSEETADPFQTPQIVNDFGTEEFVDARTIPIPVGHNSKYQANLRAKLEMAPNSPSGDGDYIVRQSGGQNTYVPITFPADELPAAPTTDGNYVLKCTVSSGTATFTWEAQT